MFTSALTEPFLYSLAVGERGPIVEGWYFGLESGSGGLVPMRCHELQERGGQGQNQGALGPGRVVAAGSLLSFRPPQGHLTQDAESIASPWDPHPFWNPSVPGTGLPVSK